MESQAVFLVLVLLSVVLVGCQHPSLPDPAFLLPYSCVFHSTLQEPSLRDLLRESSTAWPELTGKGPFKQNSKSWEHFPTDGNITIEEEFCVFPLAALGMRVWGPQGEKAEANGTWQGRRPQAAWPKALGLGTGSWQRFIGKRCDIHHQVSTCALTHERQTLLGS